MITKYPNYSNFAQWKRNSIPHGVHTSVTSYRQQFLKFITTINIKKPKDYVKSINGKKDMRKYTTWTVANTCSNIHLAKPNYKVEMRISWTTLILLVTTKKSYYQTAISKAYNIKTRTENLWVEKIRKIRAKAKPQFHSDIF